ncbi:MAG TPA: hypothetical protein PLX04_08105 [Caldisericia bacterium]|nr:hypothetical protein [Caldisericia bacterium]
MSIKDLKYQRRRKNLLMGVLLTGQPLTPEEKQDVKHPHEIKGKGRPKKGKNDNTSTD